MVKTEKFDNYINFYSRLFDKETILEFWGNSTKHPDARFYYRDFFNQEFIDKYSQIFTWILECATKLVFPSHSYEVAKFAMEYYETYKRDTKIHVT